MRPWQSTAALKRVATAAGGPLRSENGGGLPRRENPGALVEEDGEGEEYEQQGGDSTSMGGEPEKERNFR